MAQELSSQSLDLNWQSRLRDFLHDCAASAPHEQADRISEASVLLRQEQTIAITGWQGFADSGKLHAMIECGAYESAVLALIGGQAAFMLSRGGNGACIASAVHPDGAEELVAEGSTLALALLAAHVATILAEAEHGSGTIAEAAGLAASNRLN